MNAIRITYQLTAIMHFPGTPKIHLTSDVECCIIPNIGDSILVRGGHYRVGGRHIERNKVNLYYGSELDVYKFTKLEDAVKFFEDEGWTVTVDKE